jgi:toxin ParE1/3/4
MTTRRRRPGAHPSRGAGKPAARWTDRAKRDLAQIGDYISQDNPAAAARWVDALLALAERAASLPLSGRRVPEIGRDDVRELLLRNYRLVYRVLDKAIDVLTVFEGHRLLPANVVEDEPAAR